MCGVSASVHFGEKPRPRKPMPSGSPTFSTSCRWSCVSAAVSCSVSSGAPDSSNWPPGSRLMLPPSSPSGALQGDDLVALHDRLPAEAGDQRLHQGADAALALVGHRRQRVGVEDELLVLGADPPLSLGLLAGGDPARRGRRAIARGRLAHHLHVSTFSGPRRSGAVEVFADPGVGGSGAAQLPRARRRIPATP